MLRGRMFWLIWLLVGCQLLWTAMRAFQLPWTWNPYQTITAVFLMMLAVGAVWLALLWQRDGQAGIRRRIADFEVELDAPGSGAARRWNMAFWLVAGVLVFAYFRMEQ